MLQFKISIKSKLLIIFISLFLFYFIVFNITFLHYYRFVVSSANKNLNVLREKLIDVDKKILSEPINEILLGIVDSKADYFSTYFKYVEDQTEIIASYAALIYNSPGQFKKDYTKNTLQSIELDPLYFFPANIDKNKVIKEAAIFKAMESLFVTLYGNYQNVDSVYIATNSGLMLTYPFVQLPTDYDPRKRPWFTKAMKTTVSGWTDSYASSPDNKLMLTCFAPIRVNNQKILGVAGIDVSIDFLKDKIKKVIAGDSSMVSGFIFNIKGDVILDTIKIKNKSKDEKWYENYEGFNLLNTKSKVLRNYVIEMLQKKKGVLTYSDEEGNFYIAYTFIPETKWIIGIIYLVSEIERPINIIKETTSEIFLTQNRELRKNEQKAILTRILLFLFFFIIFILIIIKVAKQFVKPILYLKNEAKLIGEGNLDLEITGINTGDEIESLANSINKMTADLKKYITNLNDKVKQEEKMNSELTLAYDIQKSVLPQNFPETDQLDFALLSKPARIIGGDYYDFFKLSDNKIGILIADVIGKGIPAALYMVIVESIIHSHILDYDSPKEALEKINFIMCKNPVLVKYVPLFYAIIDLKTLELRYCNAGHEPILRYHKSDFQILDTDGFPLGAFDEAAYVEGSVKLEKDDILIFYTDGITEARSVDQVDFGINGLKNSVSANKDFGSSEIIASVLKNIEDFSKDAIQHDDLTLLILKIKNDLFK
ncbi:MAG: SpoIIE family protein phosphatase [Candidatus Margulisiibacteriota bacterium]|jgi:sigma-B regulation protein RsbU (phosphoserine phosphatase)